MPNRSRLTGWWERLAWQGPSSPVDRLAAASLRPLGWGYGKAAQWVASSRIAHSVACPVISVGNLTVGGSGKTPFAIYLAQQIGQRWNLNTAIVSRGYAKTNEDEITVVSDGRSILCPPGEAGDEAYLAAAKVPGLIVVTGADRVEAAKTAIERLGAQAIVLDDGFQHRRLARQRDLVLVDASRGLGNGRCLPAGPLREFPAALARAHWLVLCHRLPEKRNEERLRFPDLSIGKNMRVLEIAIASDALQRFIPGEKDSETASFQRIDSKEEAQSLRWMLVSGIAYPPAFEQSVKSLGIQPVGHCIHADHYRYTHQDWTRGVSEARRLGAQGILPTEKDFWKLLLAADSELLLPLRDLPLAVLTLKVAIEKGEEAFWRDLQQALGAG